MRYCMDGMVLVVSLFAVMAAAQERGVSGTASVAPSGGARKYAVIIGVNRYEDAGIGPLRLAVADAKGVYEALTGAPDGFEAERTVLLTDESAAERRPTRSNVLKFLNAFIGLAQPEDTVLVYFAGHGTTEKDAASGQDRLYLLPADASLTLLGETSIAYQSVKDLLESCPARRKVLILDACHSAAGRALTRLTRGIGDELKPRGEGTVVLVSCGADEVSHEMEEAGHGAFTNFLLEGFAGSADTNGDGFVGASELSHYTWEKTSLWAANQGFSQKPWQISTTSGDIVLAKVMTVRPDQPRCPPTVMTGGQPKAGEVRAFEGGEFAWIPPGTFEMGNRLSGERLIALYGGEEEWADYFRNEQPAHTVTLTRGFWMATKEVTNREFGAFVKATNYRTDAEKAGSGWTFSLSAGKWEETRGANWRSPGWETRPDEPVVLVSWNDAVAYCEWLSGKSGEVYRLPTEAEWEYACRAGTTTQFFWGDRAEDGQGYLNGTDETKLPDGDQWAYWFPFSDGHWRTAPVGSFRPNPWGLYDMLGNVWEWCQDWYGGYPSGPVTDPQGPTTGDHRVLRGGSWNVIPVLCRAANRQNYSPDHRDGHSGFRLLRTQD